MTIDRRPSIDEVVHKYALTRDDNYSEVEKDMSNQFEDSEENANLEQSMGVAREVTKAELFALCQLMTNPQVVQDSPQEHFLGTFNPKLY